MTYATATFVFALLGVLLAVPTVALTALSHVASIKFAESVVPALYGLRKITFVVGWTYFVSLVSIVGGMALAAELWRRSRGLPARNKAGYMPVSMVGAVALVLAACWAIPFGINYKYGTPVPLDMDCNKLSTSDMFDGGLFGSAKIKADFGYMVQACNYSKGWEITLPATTVAWALAASCAFFWHSSLAQAKTEAGAADA